MWRTLWPRKEEEEIPIGHVTNGVHLASWMGEAMHRIYRQYLSPDWLERQDEPMLWSASRTCRIRCSGTRTSTSKPRLFSAMRERTSGADAVQTSPEHLLASGIMLDHEALVIGFASVCDLLARANLIFRDIERLKALIHDRYRPVQFVFAGKAHPADDPGKRLLQELHQWSPAALKWAVVSPLSRITAACTSPAIWCKGWMCG